MDVPFAVADLEVGQYEVTVVTTDGEVWYLRPGFPGQKCRPSRLIHISLPADADGSSSVYSLNPETQAKARPVLALPDPPSPSDEEEDSGAGGCLTADGRMHSWTVLEGEEDTVVFDYDPPSALPGIRMAARCRSEVLALKENGTLWARGIRIRPWLPIVEWREVSLSSFPGRR
jgi:hypothetical protein